MSRTSTTERPLPIFFDSQVGMAQSAADRHLADMFARYELEFGAPIVADTPSTPETPDPSSIAGDAEKGRFAYLFEGVQHTVRTAANSSQAEAVKTRLVTTPSARSLDAYGRKPRLKVVRKAGRFVMQAAMVAGLVILAGGNADRVIFPDTTASAGGLPAQIKKSLDLPDVTTPTPTQPPKDTQVTAPRSEVSLRFEEDVRAEQAAALEAEELRAREKARLVAEKVAGMSDAEKLAAEIDRICGGDKIRSRYGFRIHPIYGTRKMHTGDDLNCAGGNPVYSRGGYVTQAGWKDGYGYTVTVLNHDGVSELFAHLREISVGEGQTISPAESVGIVGCTGDCTGDHVHYENIDTAGTPYDTRPSMVEHGAALITLSLLNT